MKKIERLHYKKSEIYKNIGARVVNWTVREPEVRASNEVALIIPGIMAKRRLYNPYARDVAERGITSVTMAHEGASPVCTDEVIMLAQELADSGQKPVRLVGHSLGGMHATMAAVRQPDNISGLLLVQTAGYGGVHPLHFAASLLDRSDNMHIPDEARAVLDGLDYFVSSRPDQLLRTAIMASRHEVVREAMDLPTHMAKDAILFPHDRLIRTEKLKLGLALTGFSWYELDDDITTGHNAIMYRSEAVAQLTADIMTNIDFDLAS
jgi:pimeloyl-ACP methyl ester carboxylesterase